MPKTLTTRGQRGSFRYCLDPVFLTAAVLYLLNRLVFKPWAHGHITFFAYYGNSLLCIPFCLPPVLYVYRLLGLRTPFSYPTRFELMAHLVVWSLFFKWLAPNVIKGPFAWVAADPWDAAWYAIGAAIAGGFWGAWKRAAVTPSLESPHRDTPCNELEIRAVMSALPTYRRLYPYGLLAKYAYWLACAAPLAVVLMALAWSPINPSERPSAQVQMLWWILSLSAPVGAMLGAIALYNLRVRFRDHLTVGARYGAAALTVGATASLFVMAVTWDIKYSREWERREHGPSCSSNVKQLSLAVLMYLQDYDDHFPPPNAWNETTYRYVKNLAVYRCPEAPDDEKRPTYAINGRLKNAELTRMIAPVQTVMLIDSDPGKDLAGGMELLPHPSRHNSYDTIGFVDGHVKGITEPDLTGLQWSLPIKDRPRHGG